MIWKSIRHSVITDVAMWVVLLFAGALAVTLGVRSIPAAGGTVATIALFFWIYRIVSRRL